MNFNGMQCVVILYFLNNKLSVFKKVTRTSVIPMQMGKHHCFNFITGYTNLLKCAIDSLFRLLNVRPVWFSGRNKAPFWNKSASIKQYLVLSIRN